MPSKSASRKLGMPDALFIRALSAYCKLYFSLIRFSPDIRLGISFASATEWESTVHRDRNAQAQGRFQRAAAAFTDCSEPFAVRLCSLQAVRSLFVGLR